MKLSFNPRELGRGDKILLKVAETMAKIAPEAFLVGGAVRDALLGATPKGELDIAVRGDGIEMAGLLARRFGGRATLVPLDPRRGCARIALKGNPPRSLDICSLKGRDIEEDLAARDFTINAIAVRLKDLAGDSAPLIDPLGGMEDLRRKTIRVCAPSSFTEDPLRLLRAFRFRATLGFDIAPDTRSMMKSAVAGLGRVSPERIRDELAVTFAYPHTAEIIEEMDRCAMLDHIFPELLRLKGVQQNAHHHLDVFLHTLETVRRLEDVLTNTGRFPRDFHDEVVHWAAVRLVAGRPRIWLLKLAALLHDVGKPASKFTDEEGRVRFFGHERVSAQLAGLVCTRLKLSTKETRLVVGLIENHMRPMVLTRPPVSRRVLFRLKRDLGDDLTGQSLLFLADLEASRGPLRSEQSIEDARKGVLDAMEFSAGKSRPRVEPLLTGHDIIKFCGVKPGPIVGALLAVAEEACAIGEAANKEQALALVKARMAQGIVPDRYNPDQSDRGRKHNDPT